MITTHESCQAGRSTSAVYIPTPGAVQIVLLLSSWWMPLRGWMRRSAACCPYHLLPAVADQHCQDTYELLVCLCTTVEQAAKGGPVAKNSMECLRNLPTRNPASFTSSSSGDYSFTLTQKVRHLWMIARMVCSRLPHTRLGLNCVEQAKSSCAVQMEHSPSVNSSHHSSECQSIPGKPDAALSKPYQ